MKTFNVSGRARKKLAIGAALALVAVFAACPMAAAQGVHAALTPAVTIVPPGGSFEIDLALTQAGSPINAFDAVVVYDPAALTFQQTSPIGLQVGSSMSGVCGNTFHLFRQSNDSLYITLSLLCNGASITGPAPQLYRLHFKAGNLIQSTVVQLSPATQFYNNGVFVNPLFPVDALVQIQVVTPAPGATWGRLRRVYR